MFNVGLMKGTHTTEHPSQPTPANKWAEPLNAHFSKENTRPGRYALPPSPNPIVLTLLSAKCSH